MPSSISTAQIRAENASRVLETVYRLKTVSRQELAAQLNMSLPTVTQNLRQWEDTGLIRRSCLYSSTGGRKAQGYSFNAVHRVTAGISVLRDAYHIVITDLYGQILASFREDILFSEEPDYFSRLGHALERLLSSFSAEQVSGVTIAVQGLVSPDGHDILFGPILQCQGKGLLDRFQAHIPFPCHMMHDTEASALAEMWTRRDIRDAVLLYLNAHFGGAVIAGKRVYQGVSLQSSVLEHLCLYPGGKKCYCGKSGCVEAYCSVSALMEKAGSPLPDFFVRVRNGEKEAAQIWDNYLNDLSLTIGNIRMLMDTEYMLCGQLLPYLTDEDIDRLRGLVSARCPFKCSPVTIRTGLHIDDAAALGAAIDRIKEYLTKYITLDQQ